jgi:di/tricarboxylate transporter
MDLYITIGIIVIGIFLFVKDYFTIDTTSILIMALFIVAGVLSPEEGFSGFNHPATITLGCMFVVSAAVFKSGIIDGLSVYLIRIAKINYLAALVVFSLISAVFSAFINDTAVVAIMIPIALLVARESNIAPSKLLIPISFAALFGGTCTLIGTSTNILVSSIAEESGHASFGMFEFSLPALCLLAIGMTYLFFIAPMLLPDRKSKEDGKLIQSDNYLTELIIPEHCSDKGKPIGETSLVKKYTVKIISIQRNKEQLKDIDSETMLHYGDIVKVAISPKKLSDLKQSSAYEITGSRELNKGEEDGKIIFETMVPVGSLLGKSSLKDTKFRNNFNAAVIAIRQRNELIEEDLSNVKIKEGDLLLIYASREEMNNLIEQNVLILLSEHHKNKVNYRKAIPAIIIAIGVVLTAALDITSILISGMIGALLIVTTSTLRPKEAYNAIEWKVIFMVAGVLSMGKALEKTGGADIISQFVFENMGGLDPRITLSLIFLVSFLSTNVLSSKATVALMVPIVISLSDTMQISEKPFLIAVMFACSLTFMTPVSYPVNTMVYAPGNYKFNDFLKVGTPLNIIIWIAASFIIPLFFPF